MRNKVEDITQYITGKCEMSPWESEFLRNLLKEHRPHKVLEIGVAAGATTALIMNCLDQLELDTKMYSVDLCTQYYRDSSRKTGYVLEDVKEHLGNFENHQMLTGNVVSEYLEQIGSGIDFLILDTMHVMPGEVLDFLVCLPYLTEDAVVVLHDTALNHIETPVTEYIKNAFATKVLLDTVSGDKIVGRDEARKTGYPNIAAFVCNSDTRKNIIDVFSSLSITWFYMPEKQEIESYKRIINMHYEKEFGQLFDQMVEMNRTTLEGKIIDDGYLVPFHKMLTEYPHVLFYGAGKYGRRFLEYIKLQGLSVDAFLISDTETIREKDIEGVPVMHVSEVPYDKSKCAIIMTVQEIHHANIVKMLEEKGFQNILAGDGTPKYWELLLKIREYVRMYEMSHGVWS